MVSVKTRMLRCSSVAPLQGFAATGLWNDGKRQSNLLDGGAHYYDTYQCADDEWISIGSIEPQFYALLMEKIGLDAGVASFEAQFDKSQWPILKERIEAIILTKTQAQWCEIMEGTDICFAPVLSISDAPGHHHNQARESFVEIEGVTQTAPAPRFSRTPGEISRLPVAPGTDSEEILRETGMEEATISALLKNGAVS